MWFDINFFALAVQLLPTFRQLPNFIAVVKMLVTPVARIYNSWYAYRSEAVYKMEHTGQVCYLRKSLNDKFDPIQRRIYIGEGVDYSDVIIYTEGENMPGLWIGTQSENQYQVWLRTDSEMDSDLDFIVWVPGTVYNTALNALKVHIEFYRQAGRRYAIFII